MYIFFSQILIKKLLGQKRGKVKFQKSKRPIKWLK